MTAFETVSVEHKREHIVLVTLNRPEVANAMNTQMGLDLLAVFDGFCSEPAALHRADRCGEQGVLCRWRSETAQRHDR
jgi:enoyl-CoA hydratase/carnithine racemase